MIYFAQNFLKYLRDCNKTLFSTASFIAEMRDFAKATNYNLADQEHNWIQHLVNEQLIHHKMIWNGKQKKYIYYTNSPNVFKIASLLRSKSIISHSSAAFLHGVSNMSEIINISVPQKTNKEIVEVTLSQPHLDSAFKKQQRQSNDKWFYDSYLFSYHICPEIHPDDTVKIDDIKVTSIEKTLVDMTVRPAYSGGAVNILNAYRRAIGAISIEKIFSILEQMKYKYPYYQSICFYLYHSGIDQKKLSILQRRETIFKFYLDYDMQNPLFDERWQIYFPAQMKDIL